MSERATTPSGPQQCRRCSCAIEPGDLRCAVCGLEVPADQQVVDRPVATVLRCRTCGAAVSYQVEVQAPRCAFCDSVAEVERPVDPIEQPRWALPFRVTPAQAQETLRRWLGSRGFFRPSDLANAASLESLRPLWWVAWLFNARALISWTADSDAGHGQAKWAPWTGQTPMELQNILVPASRGLTLDECFQLTGAYDLSSASETFDGPPEAVCEGFEVQRSAARTTIASVIKQFARGRLAGVIPGSTQRNVRIAVLIEALQTWRAALPAYVFAYRYRGTLYRALVHGQNASVVIGTAPWSIAKIALTLLAVVGLVGLLLLILVFFAAAS